MSSGGMETPGRAKRSLSSRLAWIAGVIHSRSVSRGERAELRRVLPDAVPPEIYWRLTGRLEPVPKPADDPFWMTVLPLMTQYPHRPGARPGEVLAAAGLSPARLERWLRRDQASAWREARRVLSHLNGTTVDWSRLGRLLRKWDHEGKMELARDFYRALRRLERGPQKQPGGE